MRNLAAVAVVAHSVLLVGCSERGATALSTSVCELPHYPQRLVHIEAEIRLRADGQAVIADPGCAAAPIELRLTGAAARGGLEHELHAASAAGAASVRVPASLSGVYTAPSPDAFFTAESLTTRPARTPAASGN